MLEVDVRGDERVVHHQVGIDDLAGAGHPALVARHGLGGADGRVAFAEQRLQAHSLEGVALEGGGGVCVDVVDVFGFHTGILHGAAHGGGGAVVARLRDVGPVGGESVPGDLSDDGCAAPDGVFVLFQNQCGGTTAGYQPVTVAVKGTRGLRGIVGADGKRPDAVETAHGEVAGT